ncbi:radical SAM protein [Lentisphaerota bacterium WC36G]|nr:radical SAM protein [Lentisphaerae bacterium WC36]
MIFASQNFKRNKFIFTEPDYIEERGNNYLLIWGNLQHWMIVDSEFYSFLRKLNGKISIASLKKNDINFNNLYKPIVCELKKLLKIGVLTKKNVQAKQKSYSTKKYCIENIALNITSKCNLRCKFCYNINNLNSESDELTAGEIISLLKSVKPFLSKSPSLTILGGEPLIKLNKLKTVLEYAAKNGFVILISTNGILITEEFAQYAAKINLQVQISIDGHNSKLNDEIRGQGCFEKLIAGTEILVKHNVYTILSLVCHNENLQYLKNFYELATNLNVNEARFIPLKNIGAAKENQVKEASTTEIMLSTAQLFKDNPKFLKLAGRDMFSITAFLCSLGNYRPSCGIGLQTFLLDADGTIYPCLNTNSAKFKIANIREDDFNFKEMWYNSNILQEVRNSTTVENMNPYCQKCFVKHWCLGGCRGENFYNNGNLNTPAVNCKNLKQSFLEIFWILSENNAILNNQPKKNLKNIFLN